MQLKQAILTFCLIFVFSVFVKAQNACTGLGQTPSTAFPVCGTSKFYQATVPTCGSHSLAVPGCENTNAAYEDLNPYWYRFTCFEPGSLGFLITPNNMGDDYDWQLYDITGHNPDEVFTNPALVVTGNWSGTYGATGAKAGGMSSIACASDPMARQNSFAAMPLLKKDHVYLLLVSHFTPTQSGYSLSFAGGTASITDPTLPSLKSVTTNCEGNEIILRTSKKMKCSSLAADGSDFSLDAAGVNIVSASSNTCTAGFDMDSIVIVLDKALSPGNYFISLKNGSDGNTLLDNCDNAITEGDKLPFTIIPKAPTPFDSIAPVNCAPQTLQLVFKRPIRCSSISDDGSDFSISGSEPVTITGAIGNCDGNSLSSVIYLRLDHALTSTGTFTVSTKIGTDGNTVIDECGETTPASQSVSFSVKDTVSADFSYRIKYGCELDTIVVTNIGTHVNNWSWTFDGNVKRSLQNTEVVYDSYGEKTVTLVVSNGFCSDTSSQVVNLDNELKANFVMPELACPKDPVTFTDTSIGNIRFYGWDFGNGSTYVGKTPPPQSYLQSTDSKFYPVQLIVENNLNCRDTLTKELQIVYSCFIAVPSAFTPNGDGVNDYLYPLNAYKAQNLIFTIYNRLGQVVYQTKDWTKKWDGRLNGQPQESGTYVWTLQYTQPETRRLVSQRGTTVLIR